MQYPAPPQRSRPRGFTLVELLVVVTIFAMLMALVTPAVMRALTSSRNAAIKAEIDMLHMAMMNYRNEFGRLPPAAVTSFTGSDAASRHLLRLFPRMASGVPQTQAQRLCYLNTGNVTTSSISVANGLPFWLYGYNDDPTQPVFAVVGSSTTSRKKLFDFDASRLAGIGTANVTYHISGKPSVPYVYIDAGSYGTVATPNSFLIGTETYRAETQSLTSGTVFFNPDTFQILCAGRDETFNTDDDLSNFWPGTRGQFRESR
jgi:prepilin-type N-terminal cleavage/methylation domain-containing protein